MAILPLVPDQTIAQMWSNGARGVRAAMKRGTEEIGRGRGRTMGDHFPLVLALKLHCQAVRLISMSSIVLGGKVSERPSA